MSSVFENNSKTKNIDSILLEIIAKYTKYENHAMLKLTNETLTLNEIHTLVAIYSEDVCPMKKVAEQLGVTISTLTISINRLVVKGFVNRIRSENDKRVVFLNLTDKGKKIVASHNNFHQNLSKKVTNNFCGQEIDAVLNALEKISQYLTD